MKKIFNYLVLLILSLISLISITNNFNNNQSNNFLNKNLSNYRISDSFSNNKVEYEITNPNTELITDLVSQSGNTNYKPVIQARIKALSEFRPIVLKININLTIIDLKESYYEQGTVDNNNFKGKGKHINLSNKNFTIEDNGIYHLYLIDNAGNAFESYLELGIKNWSIAINFDDNQLAALATELNIKVPELDKMSKDKKINLSSWLNNYKFNANQTFLNNLGKYNKGFDINIDDFKNQYQDFLEHINYIESKKVIIKTEKLIRVIKTVANDKLQTALINSESNINMHGYNLEQILNGKNLPQTKSEIDNYDNNQSFNRWLQNQANLKFSFWLVTIKVTSISLILFLLILTIIIYLYFRYRKIYQPITLKKINFNKQQKHYFKNEKIIVKVFNFIKLNNKINFWKKDKLNSYLFIKKTFSNNLDNIEYSKYDNIYYHKKDKTFLLGREFIKIILNSNNIFEYKKTVKSLYPNYDKGKLHRTILYDMLTFSINNSQHSKILAIESNFDNNIRLDLSKVRKYLKNQEWNYYFYDLQNITHKSIVKFLNWQNKALNYSAYGKVLKRKLYWLLQSEEQVDYYLAIVQNINLYRNILCKVSPLKHHKFTEWKELTIQEKTDLAWKIYLDLTKFIKFTNQYLI